MFKVMQWLVVLNLAMMVGLFWIGRKVSISEQRINGLEMKISEQSKTIDDLRLGNRSLVDKFVAENSRIGMLEKELKTLSLISRPTRGH